MAPARKSNWRGPATCVLAAILGLSGCAAYQAAPLSVDAVDQALRPSEPGSMAIAVRDVKHPLLRRGKLDASDGLSPDEAAVVAVVVNPALRAARDQIAEEAAQVLKAGILPNPQLSGNLDFVTGGASAGTQTATGVGLAWDLRAMITRGRNVQSARSKEDSIRLEVAWQEWQTALAAKSAVFDLVALRGQVAQVKEIADRLAANATLFTKAAESHDLTLLQAAVTETTANDARATLLGLQREAEQRRIALNRAIGYPSSAQLRLQDDTALPSHVDAPSEAALLRGLEDRRLDLLALKRGYESEDAKLRTAILEQFPNINIGFNRATDTGNVKTAGPAITLDLPLFDRNQAGIALVSATRKRLSDEYSNRVFEARSDIAAALAEIQGLNAEIAHAEKALPASRRVVEASGKSVADHDSAGAEQVTLQNELTQKSVDILKLKQQLVQALVALETAAAWPISP